MTYTTPNGLRFNVHTNSEFDISSNADFTYVVYKGHQLTVEDCMNRCSLSQPACYAITYDTAPQDCFAWGKSNADALKANGTTYHLGHDVAVVSPASQIDPLQTDCPYTSGSVHTTSDGQPFDILCNKDIPFGDYEPYNFLPWNGRPHADTMEECLDYCAAAHPLCEGVTWNPDQLQGYSNCFLKSNAFGDPLASDDDEGYDYITHSARITSAMWTGLDLPCGNAAGEKVISSGPHEFDIHCFQGQSDSDNITSTHQNDLSGCVGACSARADDGCLGVIFDQSLLLGYENCYLLNDTGTSYDGANMTYAELRKDGGNGGNGGNGGGSSSKTWIAGPVIGVIAALALLAAAVLWRRKRQQHRGRHGVAAVADLAVEEKDSRDVLEKDSKQGFAEASAVTDRHELSDPNSYRFYQH